MLRTAVKCIGLLISFSITKIRRLTLKVNRLLELAVRMA
jgi:hypothetical protein